MNTMHPLIVNWSMKLGLHNKLIKEILKLLGAIFSNVAKDN